MIYLITFLDNSIYTGGDIRGIYRYLETIEASTTLTTSGQRSHNFSPSSSRNNNASTLQSVIVALCTRQMSIFECCGIIGDKSDA